MRLTAAASGYIRQIITEEKHKASLREPYIPIKELHIGYLHVDLAEEFDRACKTKEKRFLIEMDGVPVIVNYLCEGGYAVVFEDMSEKHDITIGGIKPSKSWLKRYGKISYKEAAK